MTDAADAFQQVQSICDDFRRQLRQGTACQMEDYIQRVPESARANLFQQLLSAEVTARQRRNEQPTSSEYIDRFPIFASQVRQVFLEPSLSSVDGTDAPPEFEPTLITEVPVGERLGDYELLSERGRGAFGIVYEARHVRRDDRVALKTLRFEEEPDADRLHRFRQEFRRLADTNHPNLVGMQALEFDESKQQWFFTMDLVDGTDFLQYVRPDGELNLKRLRTVLPQLVNGIGGLHAQQIVHRDLKPSNVMVDDQGRVVILDFGLVAELQQRLDQTLSMRSTQFSGTIRYSAPEQLSGQRPAAADWYALGVMIFEALTGDVPFHGAIADLIVMKKTLDAPRLSERDDLPADLTSLVDQLLSREPKDRPDETQIASSLSVSGGSSMSASDDDGARMDAGVPELTLIGRETQLAQLESIRQQWMKDRQPAVVFVSGKSGEGKTALIDHFLEALRQDPRTLVLSGKCYDRESVPYKAIDGLIDSLVGYLRTLRDDDVARLLPRDISMLAQLFPVTRRVAEIANLDLTLAKRLDAKQVRDRAFNALKELLASVSQQTPLVVFIDDLQWGDAESASALMRLLTPPHPLPALVLGSFRSDEAGESPFLQQWTLHRESEPRADSREVWSEMAQQASRRPDSPPPIGLYDISVGPLSEAQCAEHVFARAAEENATIRDRAADIFRTTGGNPYLIDQLIECLDPTTGVLSAVPLNEVIGRRLKRLPMEAVALLDVIAVAEHAVSAEEAAAAAGLNNASFSTLNRMRNERLVRIIGSDDASKVETYHDKIRETVLGQLDATTRRDIHRRLGQTIESKETATVTELLRAVESGEEEIIIPVRVFDLVHHFEGAGDEQKTLIYALLAAEHAKSQFAIDVAIERFRTAFRGLGLSSHATQYRVAVGYGETLVLAGRFEQAIPIVEGATRVSQTEFERARTESILAEIAYKSGSITRSIEIYERAMRRLGIRVPRNGGGLAAHVLWQVFALFGHWIIPRSLHARRHNANKEWSLTEVPVRLPQRPRLLRGPPRDLPGVADLQAR